MSETVTPEPQLPAPPRRRWWRWTVIGLALLPVAAVGGCLILDYLRERDLREAVAEADRLDPGWRLDELEAARAEVPAAENGADLVLAAAAKMPPRWALSSASGAAMLVNRFIKLSPPTRPANADVRLLRDELAGIAEALDVARSLADRPRGRFDIAWTCNLGATLLPHMDQVREVAWLLTFDAFLRALDGDQQGALRSCRASLNAYRSLGDEPAPVSHRVRTLFESQTLRAVQRVLAQGEAPPQALEETQRALAGEAEEPLQLVATRAARASFYEAATAARSGKFARATMGMRSSFLGPAGDHFIDGARASACQADYLRYHNRLVEIAKLPAEEQQERWKALKPPAPRLPALLIDLSGYEVRPPEAQTFHQARAELRCAATALAAERFRQAAGTWPERLGDLVPDYLPAVPADPFDGRPLRLRRTDGGIIVSSVGPNNRGNGDDKDEHAPGSGVEFRLWDASRRGKAPAGH